MGSNIEKFKLASTNDSRMKAGKGSLDRKILNKILRLNEKQMQWISKLREQISYRYPEERESSNYERMNMKLQHDLVDKHSRDFIEQQVKMYFEVKELSTRAKSKVDHKWQDNPFELFHRLGGAHRRNQVGQSLQMSRTFQKEAGSGHEIQINQIDSLNLEPIQTPISLNSDKKFKVMKSAKQNHSLDYSDYRETNTIQFQTRKGYEFSKLKDNEETEITDENPHEDSKSELVVHRDFEGPESFTSVKNKSIRIKTNPHLRTVTETQYEQNSATQQPPKIVNINKMEQLENWVEFAKVLSGKLQDIKGKIEANVQQLRLKLSRPHTQENQTESSEGAVTIGLARRYRKLVKASQTNYLVACQLCEYLLQESHKVLEAGELIPMRMILIQDILMQVNRHPGACFELIDDIVPHFKLLCKFSSKLVQNDFSFANILANKISRQLEDFKQNSEDKYLVTQNQNEITTQPDKVSGIYYVDQANFSSIQPVLPQIDSPKQHKLTKVSVKTSQKTRYQVKTKAKSSTKQSAKLTRATSPTYGKSSIIQSTQDSVMRSLLYKGRQIQNLNPISALQSKNEPVRSISPNPGSPQRPISSYQQILTLGNTMNLVTRTTQNRNRNVRPVHFYNFHDHNYTHFLQ